MHNRCHSLLLCFWGKLIIFILLAVYFFFLPFVFIMLCLNDRGLKGERMPITAFCIHHNLSGKYERWAYERIGSGSAEKLSLEEIGPTEWPLFGSVFYLWATEALQDAWEHDKELWPVAPKVYASGAIEAATALITDPNHASWVKEHWGEDYLHQENVFYRMLLIAGMTSYHRLIGGEKYLEFLRDQVETLSTELDESPYGLLDDYPGQCYPTDIVAAIAAIKRSGSVLGTDHLEFINRSIRGFEHDLVDWTGLPPYRADSRVGVIGMSRGCSNQWMTVWAPELWPAKAKEWYENFEKHFWQKRWTAVGFREFPKDSQEAEWYMDVDSGPVIGGYGAAACAFGVGAARANGRFDHAYPLSIEVLLLSWPLSDGTLFGARLLSNATHAPYLGEAALLYALTRMPVGDIEITKPGKLPAFVYIVLCMYLCGGILIVTAAITHHRYWHKQILKKHYPIVKVQLGMWVALVAGGIILAITYRLDIGLLLVLLAQLLPRGFVKRPPEENESNADSTLSDVDFKSVPKDRIG
jgi:hypothetical protein